MSHIIRYGWEGKTTFSFHYDSWNWNQTLEENTMKLLTPLASRSYRCSPNINTANSRAAVNLTRSENLLLVNTSDNNFASQATLEETNETDLGWLLFNVIDIFEPASRNNCLCQGAREQDCAAEWGTLFTFFGVVYRGCNFAGMASFSPKSSDWPWHMAEINSALSTTLNT